MNPTIAWLLAFVATSITAATLVLGDRSPEAAAAPRDPATLSEAAADEILNRIREGDVAAIKGDLDGARRLWKSARQAGSGYWPLHEAIGDSLARHGFDAEAETELATAARLAATQLGRVPAPMRVKRAGLLLKLNRPEPALQLLIDGGDPAQYGSAMAHILQKAPDLIDLVKREAASRDPRLWALVAQVATDPADRASAVGRFARGVAPEDGDLMGRAIRDLRTHRRMEEALQVCEAWVRAAPSQPEAYDAWGRLLAEAGQRDRARLVLSTIVDVKPGDPAAHARLGAALRDLGDYADAIRQFEEVCRLRPEEPSGLQEIVATRVAQGDIDATRVAWSQLMSRKWESRFGDVARDLRLKVADVAQRRIDASRQAGDAATVEKLRRWCGELGVPEAGLFDIKIVMRWDAASDVDLDVMEPGGEVINHERRTSKNGAVYPHDNTSGRGPEHYTLLKAPAGTYKVGVHLHGDTRSVAEIEVILFEETPRERRLAAKTELKKAGEKKWSVEFHIP